jgi:hypothetical protein
MHLITRAGGPGLANLIIGSWGGVAEEAIQVLLVEWPKLVRDHYVRVISDRKWSLKKIPVIAHIKARSPQWLVGKLNNLIHGGYNFYMGTQNESKLGNWQQGILIHALELKLWHFEVLHMLLAIFAQKKNYGHVGYADDPLPNIVHIGCLLAICGSTMHPAQLCMWWFPDNFFFCLVSVWSPWKKKKINNSRGVKAHLVK